MIHAMRSSRRGGSLRLFRGDKPRWAHSRSATLRRQVLDAARTGIPLSLSSDRPEKSTPAITIPASIIHDILSNKYDPLHFRGLRLEGLFIEGDLDLSFLNWNGELALISCHMTGSVVLDHARVVGRVVLDGSRVKSLRALNAAIEGSLLIRNGFRADEGFYGIGIRVSGSLNMSDGHLTAPKRSPQDGRLSYFEPSLAICLCRAANSKAESMRQASL